MLVLERALIGAEQAGKPPDWTQARAVRLPDDWADRSANRSGVMWYRLSLPPVVAGGLLGLYVERACSVLQVWLNGQLVHDGGQFVEPVSRNCHQPQLVALPALLLRDQDNRLELRVRGYALAEVSARNRAGGLSAVTFGPYEQVAAQHARRSVWATRLPEVLSGALLLMGSFMFVLGWFNRAQSYLAYFGALMVGWSLLLARLWVSNLPISNRVTELLLAVLMAFIAMTAVQFLMRYASRRLRWLNLSLQRFWA